MDHAIIRATQRVIHLADTVRRKRTRATVKKTRPIAETMTKSARLPDQTPADSTRESGMNSLSCRTMRLVPRKSFHRPPGAGRDQEIESDDQPTILRSR